MKINEITLNPMMTIEGDPQRFRVGIPVMEGGHVVEKINYNPPTRIFNKGLEIGFGAYAVYFVGIPERRIVNEAMVTSAEVVRDVTNPPANAEAEVALPE